MFENGELPKVSEAHRKQEKPVLNWKNLPVQVLLKYLDEIKSCLPAVNLGGMNLEEELVLQFTATKALQSDVMDDETIAANQRAQVANSVAATLQKLIDMQEKVYTLERWKSIESLMIRSLQKLPEELAEEFLVEYERILGEVK